MLVELGAAPTLHARHGLTASAITEAARGISGQIPRPDHQQSADRSQLTLFEAPSCEVPDGYSIDDAGDARGLPAGLSIKMDLHQGRAL